MICSAKVIQKIRMNLLYFEDVTEKYLSQNIFYNLSLPFKIKRYKKQKKLLCKQQYEDD